MAEYGTMITSLTLVFSLKDIYNAKSQCCIALAFFLFSVCKVIEYQVWRRVKKCIKLGLLSIKAIKDTFHRQSFRTIIEVSKNNRKNIIAVALYQY